MPTKKSASSLPSTQAKVAKHGEKMIEIRVRFWTDDIAEKKGEVIPKHAWGSGMINIERNAAHGLTPQKWLAFNSMSEIPSVIERCLIDNDVKVISSRKMKKYALSERPSSSKR